MPITWRRGEGRKEGRKEAGSGKREAGSGKREGRGNLGPMDWPTMAKKRPQGDYPRGRD